ncbi:conjugal transfer protein [Limosilactobacillus reuteri]|uniref:Conjugal transfer protein n=1 Tax=Limosilactobacillus reuteri TaxID=1598 RepID=A0A256VH50_LIMRT|nr:conjugal transfer protein [Limosilactobacillus reuteri]OYS58052.1 conjugal transfer protein [Limosilactobacillus reuteri]OYS60238.1 conjugal transfer protein [Limosilactobacillus reuteri]OYS64653.1 conjugal transfer protein [Limosilactobacillus reuteri]OYS69934.1 conjugal transfer protein [Limosilactobacillus reuteri]OYS73062.1 conjugal transfer protein [Limosilactobacillus reuteri]
MKKKDIRRYEEANYDLDFLAQVQPQGNMQVHSRYIEMGDGYLTVLRIYRYPAQGLGRFYGVPITNNPNTMSVVSVGTEDQDAIQKKIDTAAGEQYSRISGKNKVFDNLSASGKYKDLVNLLNRMSREHEVVKRLYIRVFVYAATLDELEKRCRKIIHDNHMFRFGRYASEQLDDFQSIFVPTMREKSMINKPAGTPIDAENLTGFYPFNHIKLDDPKGSYYGYTQTRGEVMFDPFQRDDIRTRSFFFITGNAGMGKSTLLKKMNDDVFSRGAFIRNFDVSSEYTSQTKDQSGVVISLDKPEYLINPFEIFPTEINDDGTSNEIGSFDRQIDKLKNMFKFFNPQATPDDTTMLDKWLNKFYEKQNIWVANAAKVQPDIKVTNLYLPREAYPTLEDFVLFANEQKRTATSDIRRRPTNIDEISMNRITSTFQSLLTNKGTMFNGITRFPDLSNEQVVTFNLRGLQAQGQNVFNAQVYQVLTLLSGEITKNGLSQRHLLQTGDITEDDAKWYYLNLDEVENLITPHFSFGVEYLASLMEQMRKNNCAITMAAPTIKDLIMNVNSDNPYIIAVQKIFSLFQINFFFQISNDDLPRLKVALGQSTSMAELQGLTTLRRGECLMNINGDRNIRFFVDITNEEKCRYGGGM